MSTPTIPTQARTAVAAELRAELARQRISGLAMAKRLGWSREYMRRRLSGDVAFDVDDLARLARELDVVKIEVSAPAPGLEPGTCRL